MLLPPDVNGIDIFDKNNQAVKHQDKKNNVLQPSQFYHPINIMKP